MSTDPKKVTARALLNLRVPMRDGVELATHVYLPMGDGPFPVLFTRTPYEAIGKSADVLDWPGRGYALVKQDVRGRFLSDGEWYPMFNEENDAADALDWIAAQEWCNGNIAMYGGSYVGSTQLAAALTGHPALKCFTPALMGARLYRKFYNGGALRLGWQSQWTLAPKVITDQAEIRRHLPVRDMDEFSGQKVIPFWRDMLAHPLNDDFWKVFSAPDRAAEIQAPAFIRTGWFDLFVHDVFDYFNSLRERGGNDKVRGLTRILVGPWPHDINQCQVGEVSFSETGKLPDLMDQEVAYMDHFTQDSRGYDESAAPIRIFIMGSNQWRDEFEWPLARTKWTEFHLSSNGAANTASGDGQLLSAPSGEADHFVYDPANPVPTLGGAWLFDNMGQCDQSGIESRNDVLVYTAAAFTEDTEVTGPVTVKLFACSTARDTDFTAKLVDLQEDGKAMNVTDGIVRARYRNGIEELLVPGEVNELTIECNPTAYVFKKGHRVRLEISSSNFPAFSRNLNTGGELADEIDAVKAEQTIFHSPEHPSRLILPVIPRVSHA